MVDRLKQGKTDFSFIKESISHDSFDIQNVNQCEFIALSPNMNVVSVRSSDTQIDLLATANLGKVSQIATEQAKAICTTQPYVFVGSWHGKLQIYDVQREFKQVKYLKCKSAIRSICMLDP